MQRTKLPQSVSVSFAAIILVLSADGQCPYGSLTESTFGWPSGSDNPIVVYFNQGGGSFTTDEINAVCGGTPCSSGSAWANWNSVLGAGLSLSQSVQSNTSSLPSTGYHLIQIGSTTGCGEGKDGCTTWSYNGSGITLASTNVVSSVPGQSWWLQFMAHEIGHTFGIYECDGCGDTIMNGSSISTSSPTGPLCCDEQVVWNAGADYGTEYCGTGGGCSDSWCLDDENCDSGYSCQTSGCCGDADGGGGGGCEDGCIAGGNSCDDGCGDSCCGACDEDTGLCGDIDPIVIDLAGRGYELTGVANGVKFDFFPNAAPIQMSWTAAGWNGGFLALDRNGNGRIDNATELFSNITPQQATKGQPANGFAALADYDLPANGGNGDGKIDEHDAIFSKLLIWVDKNHDGVSQRDELLTMKQAGIQSISLKYAMSRWVDAYGNIFRYAAPIGINGLSNQTVYDVVLQSAGHSAVTTAATKQ